MGEGQNVHLNQSCRKFDEMPKSAKKIISLFGWWEGGGVCVKMLIWTKGAVNLMKCLNPLKIFFTVWPMGGGQNVHLHHLKLCQENFLSIKGQVEFKGGGYAMPDHPTTTPKFDKKMF